MEKILTLFDWVQEKFKTRGGAMVIGIIIGILPFVSIIWGLKDNLEYKDKLLERFEEKEERLIAERKEWEQRAYDSEKACLERLKEMSKFFNDLEDFYRNEETLRREQLLLERNKIKQYENISHQLSTIKKDLDK